MINWIYYNIKCATKAATKVWNVFHSSNQNRNLIFKWVVELKHFPDVNLTAVKSICEISSWIILIFLPWFRRYWFETILATYLAKVVCALICLLTSTQSFHVMDFKMDILFNILRAEHNEYLYGFKPLRFLSMTMDVAKRGNRIFMRTIQLMGISRADCPWAIGKLSLQNQVKVCGINS